MGKIIKDWFRWNIQYPFVPLYGVINFIQPNGVAEKVYCKILPKSWMPRRKKGTENIETPDKISEMKDAIEKSWGKYYTIRFRDEVLAIKKKECVYFFPFVKEKFLEVFLGSFVTSHSTMESLKRTILKVEKETIISMYGNTNNS